MRVIRDSEQEKSDERQKQTIKRNKNALRQMKQSIVNEVQIANKISGMVNRGSNMANQVNDLFYDDAGQALATSTMALNVGALAMKMALELWNQWREFNKVNNETEEYLRRYGVGDMTNETGFRTSLFSGKVSKRRY